MKFLREGSFPLLLKFTQNFRNIRLKSETIIIAITTLPEDNKRVREKTPRNLSTAKNHKASGEMNKRVGIIMSVRICGHELRMEKTIKPYIFFRNIAALVVLSVILITPAFAADLPSSKQQSSSSAGAIPCLPSKVSATDKTVPHKTPPLQAQRSAGTPSPALMLAMALGMRNVAGPMEYAPPVSQRQAFVLQKNCREATLEKAMPSRIAMER